MAMGDPWEDEGFGGGDEWEGKESVEAGLEDELELDDEALAELSELEDDELELDEDDDE